MKHLCIYHKNCLDGFAASLAVSEWFDQNDIPEEDREFVAAQYGDPEEYQPDVKDKFVMIVDFSYPRDVLIQMEADADRLIVIDHHKTAQEALEGLPFCHFDMSQSGAMLTWKYCFPDTEEHPVPKLIEYIQDRDIWTKALPDTDEVSAGLQSLPKTFESWRPFLNDCLIDDLITAGHSILMYQQRHIEKVTNAKIPMVYFCGHHVPCINTTTLISEIGNELSKNHPFAMMYFDTEDKRVYSLRSAKDGLDVSEIAKQFGGGGHKNAAGFSVPKSELLMSADNPFGWKLEELLDKTARELEAKTERLKSCEETPTVIVIRANNDEIVDKLDECVIYQTETMKKLDELGPNQGPYCR